MSTETNSSIRKINALIHAADCERWLAWHGPVADRAAHAAHADALIEQLRRAGVEWAVEAAR